MIKCNKCNFVNEKDTKFCVECWKKLDKNNIVVEINIIEEKKPFQCNKCNFVNEKDTKFCVECWKKLDKNNIVVEKNIIEEKKPFQCEKCNFVNEKDTKFCVECGSELFSNSEITKLYRDELNAQQSWNYELVEKIGKKIKSIDTDWIKEKWKEVLKEVENKGKELYEEVSWKIKEIDTDWIKKKWKEVLKEVENKWKELYENFTWKIKEIDTDWIKEKWKEKIKEYYYTFPWKNKISEKTKSLSKKWVKIKKYIKYIFIILLLLLWIIWSLEYKFQFLDKFFGISFVDNRENNFDDKNCEYDGITMNGVPVCVNDKSKKINEDKNNNNKYYTSKDLWNWFILKQNYEKTDLVYKEKILKSWDNHLKKVPFEWCEKLQENWLSADYWNELSTEEKIKCRQEYNLNSISIKESNEASIFIIRQKIYKWSTTNSLIDTNKKEIIFWPNSDSIDSVRKWKNWLYVQIWKFWRTIIVFKNNNWEEKNFFICDNKYCNYIVDFELLINNKIKVIYEDNNSEQIEKIVSLEKDNTVNTDNYSTDNEEEINIDEAKKFLKMYYNNIVNLQLKDAYEVSAKQISFEIFKSWYKDISWIDIKSIYKIDTNMFFVDLKFKWDDWTKTHYNINLAITKTHNWLKINNYTSSLQSNKKNNKELLSAWFNCEKAETEVEKFICNNKLISDVDWKLNIVFDKFEDNLSKEDFNDLKNEQKKWLIERDSFILNKCNFSGYSINNSCVINFYKFRIKKLQKYLDSIPKDI